MVSFFIFQDEDFLRKKTLNGFIICILPHVVTTRDQYVFSFYPENKSCDGFENAVKRYREIVPHLKLSGICVYTPRDRV